MTPIAVKVIISIMGAAGAFLSLPQAIGLEKISRVLVPMQQLPQILRSAKWNVVFALFFLASLAMEFVLGSFYYNAPSAQFLRDLVAWYNSFPYSHWWVPLIILLYGSVNVVILANVPELIRQYRKLKTESWRVRAIWAIVYAFAVIGCLPTLLFVLYCVVFGFVWILLPGAIMYGVVYCLIRFLEWLCVKNLEIQCARLAALLIVASLVLGIFLF